LALIASAMFKNVLHDVITEHVPTQQLRLCNDIVNHAAQAFWLAVLQKTLENPASEPVLCKAHCSATTLHDFANDELRSSWRQSGDTFLQHMIGVRTFDSFPNVTMQLRCDRCPC
jgi:hypothetical protein